MEGGMPAGRFCTAGMRQLENNCATRQGFEKSASFLLPQSLCLIKWCSPSASPKKKLQTQEQFKGNKASSLWSEILHHFTQKQFTLASLASFQLGLSEPAHLNSTLSSNQTGCPASSLTSKHRSGSQFSQK